MMIAAPKSGSGKTAVVCGLLRLLEQEGIRTEAFKCGPDYIDPMFHRKVLGKESCNLDSFFLEPSQLRALFCRRTQAVQAAVVEGVMGYFDGIGTTAAASSWDVARILDLPVVLVLDGRGAALSVLAQIRGFLDYRPAGFEQEPNRIAGVILNRTSSSMGKLMKTQVEEELGIPLLGTVPPLPWLSLKSRHLGLVLPDEIGDLQGQLDRLAQVLKENLDLEGLLKAVQVKTRRCGGEKAPWQKPEDKAQSFCLAVAEDEAFCFYYRENLEILKELGAEIVKFSPLRDREIPPDAQGILFGGGYPELFAEELAANEPMRENVQRKASAGMPMLAECGGYLYLMKELEGENGCMYPMAGVWQDRGLREKKLRHFGYVTVRSGEDSPYLNAGEEIRGHEFHYWQCREDDERAVMQAEKPFGGRSWPAVRISNQVMAGFPHLYYPSCLQLPRRFAAACRQYDCRKK